MIRVDLTLVGQPAGLDIRYGRWARHAGKTETEAAIDAYAAHLAGGRAAAEFRFEFSRYKEDDVRASLDQLFHGKCAYCEQRYAGTQPMDVEHWRPKGEVQPADGPAFKPGYYWLAATWTNLLPSCIDCNRERRQFDAQRGEQFVLGKANRFPLADEATRVRSHDHDPGFSGGTEEVLLLNPCIDDPADHVDFTDDGVVLGRTERGRASIQVYALNRSELVRDRLAVVRTLDYRLAIIEALAELVARHRAAAHAPADGDLPDPVLTSLEDLAAHEIANLLAMRAATEPFAGMVRILLDRRVGFLGQS